MRQVVLFLLLGLLQSCQPTDLKDHRITYINPEDLKIIHSFNPSELIDSCTYIPLETNDSILLGQIEDLKITDKYIFLINKYNNSLYVFDLQGKFLNTIGTQGRGPHEYTRIVSYDVTAGNDTVIILDPTKLFFYTTGNRFLRSIDLHKHLNINEYTLPVNAIYCAGPGKIVLKHNMLTGNRTYYSVYDYVRDKIKSIANLPVVLNFGDPNNYLNLGFLNATVWKDTISCPILYNDTIFQYTTESLIPRFVIPALKDKMISDNLIRKQNGKTPQEATAALIQSGLFIRHIYESEHYFFIIYNGPDRCELIWNKKQKKGLLIKPEASFLPITYAPIAVPSSVIVNEEEHYFDTQGNLYFHQPEKTVRLKEQISEEDNPIVVIHHLKPFLNK